MTALGRHGLNYKRSYLFLLHKHERWSSSLLCPPIHTTSSLSLLIPPPIICPSTWHGITSVNEQSNLFMSANKVATLFKEHFITYHLYLYECIFLHYLLCFPIELLPSPQLSPRVFPVSFREDEHGKNSPWNPCVRRHIQKLDEQKNRMNCVRPHRTYCLWVDVGLVLPVCNV